MSFKIIVYSLTAPSIPFKNNLEDIDVVEGNTLDIRPVTQVTTVNKNIKLETTYIKDLCPIMNKVNSNVSSKTYIENIAAYGKMMEYKDLEYIKWQEEMRKIF